MRITVLTGGSSAERDVALASAAQVVGALRARGHDVTVVDTTSGVLDREAEARLLVPRVGAAPPDVETLGRQERDVLLGGLLNTPALRDADVVFLGLHGGRGEDGTIQHMLDVAGIRYTGAGGLGSGLAIDKDIAKRLFLAEGVPTAPYCMTPVTAEEVRANLGFPVVVKASKQGSTVGLTVVRDLGGFDDAVIEAERHDDEVMVEAFIPGRELTVGVLDGEALAVGEIIPKHELFDYECKYTPGMSQEIFPADLAEPVAWEVQRLAVLAHQALKLRGYSRVDFRLTPEGRLFCLEVNTLPGMTATSLLPQSAKAVGMDFGALCERICELALEGERRTVE